MVSQHSGMICLDLRGNPGYSKKRTLDYLEVMREQFFNNIMVDIEKSQLFGNCRIKIDWIHPEALGLKGNKLDVHDKNKVGPLDRQKYFVDLCTEIGKKLNLTWDIVLNAFLGNQEAKLFVLKKQLNSIKHKGKAKRGRSKSKGKQPQEE